MTILILHDKNENNWNSLGLGPLNDAIEPRVTRARNGEYTLSFTYPMMSPRFKDLEKGNWIVSDAGPKQESQSQRFEIQTVTKPMNGIVTVYAEHYRYQLLRSVLKKAEKKEGTVNELMRYLLDNSEPKLDFKIKSVNRETRLEFDLSDPFKFTSTMDAFGGAQGSILDKFGGEFIFDNDTISLQNNAGSHTKVVIAYGKNLKDISQEDSIENTYTSIYPWAKIKDENTGEEKIITVDGDFVHSEYVENYRVPRIESIDFSQRSPKDKNDLLDMAKAYVKNNKIGIPKISIKSSFVDLSKSVMGSVERLDQVDLCDYVHIHFKDLKISTEAQIIKTVYRPDLESFESVELGEAKTNLRDVVNDKVDDINDKLNDLVSNMNDDWMDMQGDLDDFNDILNNPGKGKVVIWPSLSDPQNIFITDNKDINLAQKMWRWSEAGLAYSSTGLGGPWTVGMTKDGQIVADLINVGTLKAIDIMGVTIKGSTVEGGIITNEGKEFRATFSNGRVVWFDKTKNEEFFSIDAGTIYEGTSNTENTIGLRPLQGDSIYIGRDKAWIDSKYGFYRFNEGSTQIEIADYDHTGKYHRTGSMFWIKAHGERSDPSITDYNKSQYSEFQLWGRDGVPTVKMGYSNMKGSTNPSRDRLSGEVGINFGSLNFTAIRRSWSDQFNFLSDNHITADDGSHNNTKGWLQIYSMGYVTVQAPKFTVSGTKNATVRTENHGDRLLNAYETPEIYFADYGEAVTGEDGTVRVDIDPIFAETIVTSRYMVFLTPTEMVKCAVIHEDVDHFIIKTDEPNVLVRWNLVAHRLGYQDVRLDIDEDVHHTRIDKESRLLPEEKSAFNEAYYQIDERKKLEKKLLDNNINEEELL